MYSCQLLVKLDDDDNAELDDQGALGADLRWIKKAQTAARGLAKWYKEIKDSSRVGVPCQSRIRTGCASRCLLAPLATVIVKATV